MQDIKDFRTRVESRANPSHSIKQCVPLIMIIFWAKTAKKCKVTVTLSLTVVSQKSVDLPNSTHCPRGFYIKNIKNTSYPLIVRMVIPCFEKHVEMLVPINILISKSHMVSDSETLTIGLAVCVYHEDYALEKLFKNFVNDLRCFQILSCQSITFINTYNLHANRTTYFMISRALV